MRTETAPFGITGRDDCIVVAGELDMATAPELLSALLQVGAAAGSVVVDLQQVHFIDLAGLAALETGARILGGSGANVVLRHPSPAVNYLLGLCDHPFPWSVEDSRPTPEAAARV